MELLPNLAPAVRKFQTWQVASSPVEYEACLRHVSHCERKGARERDDEGD